MRKVLWHIARLVRDSLLRSCRAQGGAPLSYLFVGFFFLGSGSISDTVAQTYLSVRNLHRPARTNYALGDKIAVKIDGQSTVYRGELNALNDTSIVLGDVRIELYRIDMVLDYSARTQIRNLSNSAFLAIPLFIVYTGLQNLINTGERPLIDKPALVLSGIYGSLGLGLRPFGVRRYKMGKRWDLKVIDTSFSNS